MSILSEIVDNLPMGQGAKMALGFGVAILSIGGYKLAAPGSALPVLGYQYAASSPQFSEAKKDGSKWDRLMYNHAFYRKVAAGDTGGLREFHVKAGQRVIFDYQTQMECGHLSVSIDLAGVARRSSNRATGDNRVEVTESGKGTVEIIAADTGVHRVHLRHYANGERCGAMWYASWKVRDA